MTDVKAVHRLLSKDADALQGECSTCGPIDLYRYQSRGKTFLRCGAGERARSARREASRPARDRALRYPWRRAVEERLRAGVCERCGFVAEDLCQLDADHVVRQADGGTDDPSNLIVLCACCHRLKSKQERLPHFSFPKFMAT